MNAETQTTRTPRLTADPLANPVEVGRLTGAYYMVMASSLMLIFSIWFNATHAREVVAPVVAFGLAGFAAATWLGATYIKDAFTDPERRNRFKGFQTTMVISIAVLAVLGFIAMAYTNATNGLKVNGVEASIVCIAMFVTASFVQAWRTKAGCDGVKWGIDDE